MKAAKNFRARKILVMAAIAAQVFFLACASPPFARPAHPDGAFEAAQITERFERSIEGDVPEFARVAAMGVPQDALVAIGAAEMASGNMSRTVAQTMARADIVRQLQAAFAGMVADFGGNSAAEILFLESVLIELSESRLRGAVIAAEGFVDGEFWMVVALGKANAAMEIAAAAESAARLVPGVSAAMWSAERIDSALRRQGMAPIVVAFFE